MSRTRKIPVGWVETTLGEFMKFKNGVNADKDAYGRGTKFVNVMDIFKKSFLKEDDITGAVQITKKQLSEYSVVNGDILFNRTSETPEEIAYSAVYTGDQAITFGGFVIRGRQTKNFLLPEFARHCFKSDRIRKEMIRRSQGKVRANIGQKDLNKIPILIPTKDEQKKIAHILSTWDMAIEKTERLIAAKEKQLNASYQNYFQPDSPKNKNWQSHRIGEFVKVRKERSVSTEEMPLYSLTIEDGVTAKTDRYNREFLVKDQQAKTYKVAYPRDIVFNPSNLRWGAIARSEVPTKVTISPIYEVLEVNDNLIDNDFLTHAITCPRQIGIFATKVEGTLIERMAIKVDVFQLCEILVPQSVEEQQQVAKILNAVKRETRILRTLAEKYRAQKRGLMQKLLTEEWRISC